MAEARTTECLNAATDPGNRDSGSESGSRPIALNPPTGMRFYPIVSIRTGAVAEDHGKARGFASRFDGKKDKEGAGTASTPSRFFGHDFF